MSLRVTDVVLETDRLILRRLTMADLDALVELDGDPAVMRYITDGAEEGEVLYAMTRAQWLAR